MAHVAVGLGQAGAFRSDVAVVEGEVRRVDQAQQLEHHVGLVLGLLHRVAARRVPGALEGIATERVETLPDEVVPVADGEAQVLLHRLAQHQLLRLVVLILPGFGLLEEGQAHEGLGLRWDGEEVSAQALAKLLRAG